MKNLAILLGILSLPCPLASAQERSGGGMGAQYLSPNRPAPAVVGTTDAQLRAMQNSQRFGGLSPKDLQKRETWDLEGHSEYIQFDGNVTLIPKGSILFAPDKLQQHVATGLSGKFMLWPDFSARYRGLVTTVEVNIDQASGAKPLDEAKMAVVKRQGLIIVAVLNGNPISVNPCPATAGNTPQP